MEEMRSIYQKRPKSIHIITENSDSQHMRELTLQIDKEGISRYVQSDTYQLENHPEKNYELRFVVVDNLLGPVPLGQFFTAPCMIIVGYPTKGRSPTTKYCTTPAEVIEYFKFVHPNKNLTTCKSIRLQQSQLEQSKRVASIKIKTINKISDYQSQNKLNMTIKTKKSIAVAKRLLIYSPSTIQQGYRQFLKTFGDLYPGIPKAQKQSEINGFCLQSSFYLNYVLVNGSCVNSLLNSKYDNFEIMVFCEKQSQCFSISQKARVICVSSCQEDLLQFIENFGISGVRKVVKPPKKKIGKKKKLAWAEDSKFSCSMMDGYDLSCKTSVRKLDNSSIGGQSLFCQIAFGTQSDWIKNDNGTQESCKITPQIKEQLLLTTPKKKTNAVLVKHHRQSLFERHENSSKGCKFQTNKFPSKNIEELSDQFHWQQSQKNKSKSGKNIFQSNKTVASPLLDSKGYEINQLKQFNEKLKRNDIRQSKNSTKAKQQSKDNLKSVVSANSQSLSKRKLKIYRCKSKNSQAPPSKFSTQKAPLQNDTSRLERTQSQYFQTVKDKNFSQTSPFAIRSRRNLNIESLRKSNEEQNSDLSKINRKIVFQTNNEFSMMIENTKSLTAKNNTEDKFCQTQPIENAESNQRVFNSPLKSSFRKPLSNIRVNNILARKITTHEYYPKQKKRLKNKSRLPQHLVVQKMENRVKCPVLFLIQDEKSMQILPQVVKVIQKGQRIITHSSQEQLNSHLSISLFAEITFLFTSLEVNLNSFENHIYKVQIEGDLESIIHVTQNFVKIPDSACLRNIIMPDEVNSGQRLQESLSVKDSFSSSLSDNDI